MSAGTPAGELGELLDRACTEALKLISNAPVAPRRLSLAVGEVTVRMEWPQPGTPAAAPVAAAPAAVAPVEAAPAAEHCLTAGTVGVFYRAPEPGAEPFVGEGDRVVPGQQVGIVEAMKLMIPVEADRAGRVVAVLVEDGQPVEFGDPLFALDLDDRG